MAMATMATKMAVPLDATLALLRWRQTRRGYDGDDQLLQTAFCLLESDSDGLFGPQSALRVAEQKCNIPADRIATELLHFALLLITKPRHRDGADATGSNTQSSSSRAVLRLLHLSLKSLRALDTNASSTSSLVIPVNACNLLLSAMADTLESVRDSKPTGDDSAVNDVLQIFVFLFGMSTATAEEVKPSFNMYKPPTNVFTTFMQRACTAIFAQLDASASIAQGDRVALVHAIMRVFQELQFTQMNKKKVFVSIAKTSFREIAGYRHALLKHQEVDGVRGILTLLDRIIVDALFDSDHLRQYDGALSHIRMWQEDTQTAAVSGDDDGNTHKAKKAKRDKGANNAADASSSLMSYQRHLFNELKSFLADNSIENDAKESIGSLLEVLVEGYATRIRAAANEKIEDTRADLKSSKKRVANVIATTSTAYTPFKFWAELCGLSFSAFHAVQQQQNKKTKTKDQEEEEEDEPLAMLVGVCDSLFQALCDSDVYRVTEDTLEQEQFHMMQTILSRLIELLRASDSTQSLSSSGNVVVMTRVCRIISNAVRCTPNLVNSSLVSIFDVLGGCSHGVQNEASASMVELLRAYESMRLVDEFLKACCSAGGSADEGDAVPMGLLTTFAHSATETALRRTFMTLPPGQLEIVWRLLTDKLAVLCSTSSSSKSNEATAATMALVRFFFAVFLQEIHITPQNRAKIGELVMETHEKLFEPLSRRITQKKAMFSIVEREQFSLFGEFLALYDGLALPVRSSTVDIVLHALSSSNILSVMTSLLAGNDKQIVGAAAGVIKIGVHWLRQSGRRDEETVAQGIASLIVDRVLQWRCWDAVAFYLPELVDGVSPDQATVLYSELLQSYLTSGGASGANQAASARILRDAAFYEIATLQRVAPEVFTRVLTNSSDDAQAKHKLFEYLLAVPVGYVDTTQSACSQLLCAVLRTHQLTISTAKTSSSDKANASLLLHQMALWIEKYLVSIATAAGDQAMWKQITSWAEFLLLDASASQDESCGSLIQVVIQLAASHPAHLSVDKPLSKLLSRQDQTPHDSSAMTSARVLEAISMVVGQQQTTAFATTFVDALTVKIQQNPSMLTSFDSDASFQLMTSLVKFLASLPQEPSSTATTSSASGVSRRRCQIVELLQTHMSGALAVAMQRIVGDESGDHHRRHHHTFFTTFCASYHLLRPIVTMETFGCLLAVALVLATHEDGNDEKPLRLLVQHTSKDEFRLLIATLLQELRAPRTDRVIAALKALVFLLETDKKLSPSRRQLLSEYKASFLELFVHIFSRTLTQLSTAGSSSSSSMTTPVAATTSLVQWNLRVFVLFYCKAELFTWRPHELLQIFAGFQPLTVIAAQSFTSSSRAATTTATTASASETAVANSKSLSAAVWTPAQIHHVWLLSYNLLLRIVRHHFASLVNAVPHMVDALHSLLRVLLATSHATTTTSTSTATDTAEKTSHTIEWSSNLARLYGYLKQHDVALRKHVVYLLVPYLRGVTQGKLSLALQHKLRPGVFALLEICSPFEKEQLYASLDSTGKSLLKSIDTSYKLTYRYAGKV